MDLFSRPREGGESLPRRIEIDPEDLFWRLDGDVVIAVVASELGNVVVKKMLSKLKLWSMSTLKSEVKVSLLTFGIFIERDGVEMPSVPMKLSTYE